MTDDNRKKLLEIISRYHIMPEVEVFGAVKNLNDQEVELLISTYSDLDSYYDAVDGKARIANPKKMAEIDEEHDRKLKEIDRKYRNEELKALKEEDGEFEKVEDKASKKMDESIDNLHKDIEDIGKLRDEFYSKINKAVAKQQADFPTSS